MMEEQALCRIHRLGQRKEVKTIRYRIRGSFEAVRRIFFSLKVRIEMLMCFVASRQDARSQETNCLRSIRYRQAP